MVSNDCIKIKMDYSTLLKEKYLFYIMTVGKSLF
jgi:hypothetical protein